MRFSTDAPRSAIESVATVMATVSVDRRDHGLTLFVVNEHEATAVCRGLRQAGFAIHAGWPRGLAEPHGYATASAHVRR